MSAINPSLCGLVCGALRKQNDAASHVEQRQSWSGVRRLAVLHIIDALAVAEGGRLVIAEQLVTGGGHPLILLAAGAGCQRESGAWPNVDALQS